VCFFFPQNYTDLETKFLFLGASSAIITRHKAVGFGYTGAHFVSLVYALNNHFRAALSAHRTARSQEVFIDNGPRRTLHPEP